MKEKNEYGIYKNNIQQYIEAYKETLEDMGADGILVRLCTKPELDSELGAELQTPLTNDEKQNIRNPGKTGNFWLSSIYYKSTDNRIYNVKPDGSMSYDYYDNEKGVRPVIEIY